MDFRSLTLKVCSGSRKLEVPQETRELQALHLAEGEDVPPVEARVIQLLVVVPPDALQVHFLEQPLQVCIPEVRQQGVVPNGVSDLLTEGPTSR